MCEDARMRLYITLDDGLVDELDRRVGERQRNAFIAELVRRGLEDEQRWEDVENALASISDKDHEWDSDPAEWVRSQRQLDVPRSG